MTEETPKTATVADLVNLAKAFEGRIAELESQVLNLSQALAEKEHGTETVRSACKWAGPNLAAFAAEHHPYDALVHVYKANGSH